MRRQGIYWMCQRPQDVHHSKAALLNEIDYDVTIVESPEALRESIKSKRVSIIIVDDEGDKEEVERCITEVANMPEIHGARLILSISREDSETIMKMALLQGFRDIIHLSWDEHTWLERFEFSTAAQPVNLETGNKAVRSSQTVSYFIPARLTWVDEQHMWIESKARPSIGQSIRLIGPICESLHAKELPIHIESSEKNGLFFRFSESLVGRWRENVAEPDGKKLLSEIKKLDHPQKPRVFVAVQSPALRSTILSYLDQNEFEVHTALQKKSLVKEPQYFSPHLVFIEDRLCSGEAMSRFLAMSQGLPESSTIVVIGGDDDLTRYVNFSAGRKLKSLSRIPKNLKEIVKNQYLVDSGYTEKTDRHRIPQDHIYSRAEIEVSSQARFIAADRIEIDLPFKISNFGMIRFKNRLLAGIIDHHSVYGKIVSIREKRSGTEVATIRFSNMSTDQQNQLQQYLSEKYK